MLKKILSERGVPALRSREEMLDIIQKEEFGYMPPAPDAVSFSECDFPNPTFCAGSATIKKINITSTVGERDFTFPVYVSIPTTSGKHPFFVCVNFRDSVPDQYIPIEEIIDQGFAVLSFNYEDVTTDNGDFTNGLAGIFYENGTRGTTDAGKIAIWAWAAQRVMDYALSLPELDADVSCVCGHSRLGKTALLCAATDQRFKFAYSNDSGCSGAAISRGKRGESIRNIYRTFPFWFCESYAKYVDNESSQPFDQHYLIASIAPRFVCVGSAETDIWADPESEMLACVGAGAAYEEQGLDGFISADRFAEVGEAYFDGSIGYHLRRGCHFFSRHDWNRLIEFINLKTK